MGKVVGLTFKAPDPEFICPVCNKPYRRESDLLKHIEKEHPDYGKTNPDNGGGGT